MHEKYDSHSITELRSAKNRLDPFIPYHFLNEKEPGISGEIETINTIFLTCKECAFKCLMCDLWKNTLDEPLPQGAIVKQIEYALERLPGADNIKLYNNGNFFDTKAIYPKEYPAIIQLLKDYKRVIVENHPALCNKNCIEFNEMIEGKLEVAMGLETIHPNVLPGLNKQLTKEDFKKATGFLKGNGIDVRAFILLNPPFLKGRKQNIEWTFSTVEFAFDSGADCCSIIPVRAGNGIMDILQKEQKYEPPTLDALEEVFEQCLNLKKGRVFVDTWNIQFTSSCSYCFLERKDRLEKMNMAQQFQKRISCNVHQNHG